jgi:hypothetical protein
LVMAANHGTILCALSARTGAAKTGPRDIE